VEPGHKRAVCGEPSPGRALRWRQNRSRLPRRLPPPLLLRPPPPPPGRPPPPPPPPRKPPSPRGRSCASSTRISRPSSVEPLSSEMALAADCASPMVTNAKPRACPVSRSVGTATSRTSPTAENAASMDAWVVPNDRFPTKRRFPTLVCIRSRDVDAAPSSEPSMEPRPSGGSYPRPRTEHGRPTPPWLHSEARGRRRSAGYLPPCRAPRKRFLSESACTRPSSCGLGWLH
jgi:hypothetical protein